MNGESRSATTAIAASYQSFEISSSIPDESSVLKDSLYNIPVTTLNAAGTFIKEELSVSIINLTGPARLSQEKILGATRPICHVRERLYKIFSK